MVKNEPGGPGADVEFPTEGTDPTRCKTRSQSRIEKTRHGVVKVVESVPVSKDKS